jgi:lipid II:glycine glycyltransferase (peptidoglycan interpeptide bridge formation enzyme)
MHTTWQSTLGPREARAFAHFLEDAPDAHFTQDPAFADVAVAGKRQMPTFFVAHEGQEVAGVAVVLRPRAFGPFVAPVAIVQRGPVCGHRSRLEPVLRALVKTARDHGVARIAVMPYWSGEDAAHAEGVLAATGFRNVQEPSGSHACTLRLDIGGKSDCEILSGNERKKLRYELRSAARAGVTVRHGHRDDFDAFARLEEDLARAQGRRVQPPAWFSALEAYLTADPSRGALFVSTHEEVPIAAALTLRYGKTAVYFAGASIVAPRPFSKMALPLFAAVQWARDHGCDTFDLGGVPLPGDTDGKRAAIAQFKRDFAKTPVYLVPEHARWF